jgi:hypothetical protein
LFAASIGSNLETTNDLSLMGIYRFLYASLKYIVLPFLALVLKLVLKLTFIVLVRAIRRLIDCCKLRRNPSTAAAEEEEVERGTGIPRECHVEMISILDSVRRPQEADDEMEEVPLDSPAHNNYET